MDLEPEPSLVPVMRVVEPCLELVVLKVELFPGTGPVLPLSPQVVELAVEPSLEFDYLAVFLLEVAEPFPEPLALQGELSPVAVLVAEPSPVLVIRVAEPCLELVVLKAEPYQ